MTERGQQGAVRVCASRDDPRTDPRWFDRPRRLANGSQNRL